MKTMPILLGFCALLLAATASAAETPSNCTLPAISQMEDAAVLPWEQPAHAEALSPVRSAAGSPIDLRLSWDCPEDPPNCCRWILDGECFVCILTC